MIPKSADTAMRDFYQEVLEDFARRLFNKFNYKFPGFNGERIDFLKEVLNFHIILVNEGKNGKPPRNV